MKGTCGQTRGGTKWAVTLGAAVFGTILFCVGVLDAAGNSPLSSRSEDAKAALRRASTVAAETPGGPRFLLRTDSFSENQQIPRNFTCDGQDISPVLTWTEPPPHTRSFVLIAEDPDAPAGTWVHWVVYNLRADARRLPQATPRDPELKGGGRQGVNDFRKIGYNGPCPPPGKPHRYFFRLYALDSSLDLPAGTTKAAIEQAMKGHVLAETHLVGRYGR